jgi:hypothetical protein
VAKNPLNIALAIDVVASAGAAAWRAFSIGRRSWTAAFGLVALCFSKAFMDY